MNNLNWISEIEDVESVIKSLSKKDPELCSFVEILFNKNDIARFALLYEQFGKTVFTFKYTIINDLMKKYVEQYYFKPVKDLAVTLGVHTRTIYAWLAEIKKEGE